MSERELVAAAAAGDPAVALLPEGQRDAVLMHYVDDLSCEEIARLLGTTGAVRVRLHRAARDELADKLARDAKGDGEGSRRGVGVAVRRARSTDPSEVM